MQATHEQQEVLDFWGESLAIEAGAGCGKTTTLVSKCIKLLERDPTARFLAISFTEKSAEDLKIKLIENIRRRFPALFADRGAELAASVSTIHGFFSKLLREFSDQTTQSDLKKLLSGQERMLTENESRLLWKESFFSGLREASHLEPHFQFFGIRGLQEVVLRLKTVKDFGMDLRTVETALRNFSEKVGIRYQQKKQRVGALDFNDLEIFAEILVQDPWIAETIRARYDLIMIDEFQDTNPLQAKILEQIFLREPAPERQKNSNGEKTGNQIIIVGDPKQSIYRFRDADLTVFESWVKRMERRVSLSFNFRSTPHLLNVVNQVCEPLFESHALPYTALQSGKSTAGGPDETGDEKSFEEPGRVFWWESLDLSTPAGLRTWAHEMKRLQETANLGDCALLLRRIRGNEKLFEALRAAGVGFVLGSGSGFWEDPRVSELLSFLEWMAFPFNRLAQISFMRSPLARIPDAQITEWLETLGKSGTSVHGPKGLLEKSDKHAGSIQSSVHQLTPGQILASIFEWEDLLPEYSMPILRLWNVCEDLSRKGYRFDEVVRELQRWYTEQPRETEIPPPTILCAESGNASVKIMSIHAAKGLEFDTVFLGDLLNPKRESRISKVLYDRSEGVCVLSPEVPESIQGEWLAREKAKDRQEWMRLFYVALTRAKKNMVLLSETVDRESTVGKRRFEGSWLEAISAVKMKNPQWFCDISTWEESRDVVLTKDQRIEMHRPHFSVSNPNPMNLTWTKRRWSVTELIELEREPLLTKGKSSVKGGQRFSLSEAADFGQWAHQAILYQERNALEKLEGETGVLASTIVSVLEERGLWNTENGYREFAFEVPVSKVDSKLLPIVVGAIDYFELPVSARPGRLVDFKFLQKSKSNLELMERYRSQLEWYAWALAKTDPVRCKNQKWNLEILAFAENKAQSAQWTLTTDDAFCSTQETKATKLFHHALEAEKRDSASPVSRYMVHSSMGLAPSER